MDPAWPAWPNWGRPDVTGVAQIAPYRSSQEALAAAVEIVVRAFDGAPAADLRRRGLVHEQRFYATPPERVPYVALRDALELSATSWWLAQVAIAAELEPIPQPLTAGDAVRVACAIAGVPAIEGFAELCGRLVALEIVTLAGDGPLHARTLATSPAFLELALTDRRRARATAAPDVACPDGLADRVAAALGASGEPAYVGDLDTLPAIAMIAAQHAVALVVARTGSPGAIVRDALVDDAVIVAIDADPEDPRWSLHRRGVLLVGAAR